MKKLRKSCKYQKKYLSLQRERNLFMFAPVGPASKAIKAEFLFVVVLSLLKMRIHQ